MQALIARIAVSADEALLADYPTAWLARVALTTPSGRHECVMRHVPGDPARPFGDAEVARKFRRLAAPVIGDENDERFLGGGGSLLRSKAAAPSIMRDFGSLTGRP